MAVIYDYISIGVAAPTFIEGVPSSRPVGMFVHTVSEAQAYQRIFELVAANTGSVSCRIGLGPRMLYCECCFAQYMNTTSYFQTSRFRRRTRYDTKNFAVQCNGVV
jgi:hypothetical protein